MKLTGVLTLVPLLHLSAAVYSQQVTLKGQRVKIKDALRTITKQTGYGFLYNSRMLDVESSISIDLNKAPLSKAIEEILESKGLTYKIEEKTIVLLPKEKDHSTVLNVEVQDGVIIKGKITNEAGKPLVGATVQVEGQKLGCTCGNNGEFELKVPKEGINLIVSFVGYEKQTVKAKKEMTIVLKSSSNIDEVTVSTGYFNRTKESATGSQVVVSGEDLKKVGSLNLMQALNAFDPSIRVAPNLEFGSDPNRVPEITVRGENGFDLRSSADDARSNPNGPLYLLDGIEVSPTRIYDLDMNRIESFVILRDASATSLYGSRGANGVILITTIPPKEGDVRITFNSTTNVSVPDLRDYNLMNSSEKLQYEVLGGVYRGNGREEQIRKELLYNERLAEVARGVDTYWLSKPLTTSVNQRYTAFVEGGDRTFRYGVNLNYDKDKGVMKESGRDRYGINVSFNYYPKSGFLIRNDVTVNNVKGYNSPYGSFSAYARLNPIERVFDAETGQMIRSYGFNNAINPLVDASLPNIDYNKYTEIQDNFNIDWRINNSFRVTGRASLTKKLTKNEKYISPLSSSFDKETDSSKKGSYYMYDQDDLDFDGTVTASYNKVFLEKITTNIGVGANTVTTSGIGEGYTATGFLSDNMNFIQYAQKFKENSRPNGYFDKSKMIGFFGNANIGYENRYFVDLSFRTDGSSRFGKNSRFAPFWSAGAAWNMDREKWWNSDATLKLRASIGSTGSVNFSADQALTKYFYDADYEYNGYYGAQLLGYGNSSLKWQNTVQNNIGADLVMLKNLVVLNIDAYVKNTQNLLLPIDVAPSTGFSSYTENLGSMENRGMDLRLRFNVLRGSENPVNWNFTLGAATNKNKIKKLSNALEAMNLEAAKDSIVTGPKPLRVYEAGRSQSALMVVESLGIDPMTGNEIYKKLNGDLTYTYDPKDKIIVGDMNPTWMGTFQSNLLYKNFNLYFILAYEYGAKIYNSTLAQKVEGSDPLYNADKRVLYDRWKQPGDVTLFKRIDDTTPPYQTTRLVQKNDFLRLQTLTFSYELPRERIERMKIERAKIMVTANDLFRFSTVKMERGTSYPFAQTVSLALNLTF
ncbi:MULTISPECIES: SusC/RagA family TonB-linked outer membrane protein [Sphingobacterium]|uniref:SusC/RagA family TonB-linked outer membrane protein n=1 Tax=Sphingobacterium TaxID=28453 RepID=UPI0013DA5EB1|nr:MULTISPECIES: SusC/RagA family TonB-linked outer membrane protein [unclassified Sphingobacterium]